MKRKTSVARFWEKVDKNKYCWEWRGHISKENRYGKIRVDGRKIAAHRFSYMLHFGEIPNGIYVCHKCDNPKCVRPDHLFLGTPLDNRLDMIKKNRARYSYGENHGMSKITDQDVFEIRSKYRPRKYSMRKLAKEYGISQPAIRDIINREHWKHIP